MQRPSLFQTYPTFSIGNWKLGDNKSSQPVAEEPTVQATPARESLNPTNVPAFGTTAGSGSTSSVLTVPPIASVSYLDPGAQPTSRWTHYWFVLPLLLSGLLLFVYLMQARGDVAPAEHSKSQTWHGESPTPETASSIQALPEAGQKLFGRALQAHRDGNLRKAESLYVEALRLYPGHAELYNNLGVLQAQRGDYEAAYATFERALATLGSTWSAYTNINAILALQASQAYQKALGEGVVAPKLYLRAMASPTTQTPLYAALGSTAPLQETPPGTVITASATASSPALASVTSTTAQPASTAAAHVAQATSASVASVSAALPPAGSRPTAIVVAQVGTAGGETRALQQPATTHPTAASTSPSTPQATTPITTTSGRATASSTSTTATPAATTKPTASRATPASTQAAQAALLAWAKAWQDKNLAGYFAAYVPGYAPPGKTHDNWKQERRDRIIGKDGIRVSLDKITLKPQGEAMLARFMQRYQSGALSLTAAKVMRLEWRNGHWLIAEENAR